MKASTIIYALALAGTCASRPFIAGDTRTSLAFVGKAEHQTTQRAPAALPTNSAGEIVFPHGMNGHTIHPIPTKTASHPVPVSTVHEARDNDDSAPGNERKNLEVLGWPHLGDRAVAEAPFPSLHGAKNSTVDVPDHGRLPPYTHHHPRDDDTLEAVNHRHLPPWKLHHGPHRNESTEIAVDHRRLPSWMLRRPTTTMAKMTSRTAAPTSALEAATSTAMLAFA
ncbi:hypothetical protein MMC27_007977 [Xylographa pallens]|nr:hypothetical protein [Xylographa pallens]